MKANGLEPAEIQVAVDWLQLNPPDEPSLCLVQPVFRYLMLGALTCLNHRHALWQ
jgi:hypothetical protein